MLFVGEFRHTLDAKKRVFIPAKYREYLGENFYIACKMNRPCLAIYTEADMNGFVEKLEAFPDSEVTGIKQALFSLAAQVSPDTNGRVVLLPHMLTYAGIEKNVVIVGSGSHLQIWSEEYWAKETANRDMDLIRSQLASVGL